jgi:putative ABC transport system permease protein
MVEGDFRPAGEEQIVDSLRRASPDYFKTMGIPLIAGRTFRDSDDSDAPGVVLINRTLARKRWGKEDPVGKRISLNGDKNWMTIVGIVGDVKEFGLNVQTPPQMYRPIAQVPDPGSVLIRTVGDPTAMAEQIRRALHQVDPQMPIARMLTMEQARADSVSSSRTLTRLFGLFAIVALVIAAVGIGSMLALWVRQRVREIGIRMALGAGPERILRTFVRRGMTPVIVGLIFGLAGAFALTRLLKALLFQVEPTDVVTFVLISTLLLVSGLFACLLPARHASRIDPQAALRSG